MKLQRYFNLLLIYSRSIRKKQKISKRIEKILLEKFKEFPLELNEITLVFDEHLWEKKFQKFAEANNLKYEKDNKDFVLKFNDGTYYSKNVFWKGTSKNKATWLSQSDAFRIQRHLNQPRIKMGATLEKR